MMPRTIRRTTPLYTARPRPPVLADPHFRRSPLRTPLITAACVAALLCPPAWSQNQLPALGDPASEDFNLGTERKLGDEIMREIRADPDYLDDPVLLEYLQSLWQPLLAQARVRGNITPDIDQRMAWEPFLVRDRSVNAFALPGGYVGVHLGLMAITATRDELASVLAHEMSHVTQRHIARSIGNSKRQSLVSLAGLIVGVLAASRAGNSSVDAANAAIAGSQALAIQGQLNFSRDMEREADRVGFSVMSGAGFAPGGMAAMFEKLDQSSRLNDSGGFPYLRSHPLTTDRIGEARSRLGTAAPVAPVSVLEHSAAQARARVLMDARVDALRRWQALDGDRGSASVADKLANAYESALASTLLRDWVRADASIAAALNIVRTSPRSDARAERAVALLNAQSLLARGDVSKANAALSPYINDGSRPVLLLSTQAVLAEAAAATKPDEAALREAALKQRASELQTWVAVNPRDPMAWTALSQVSERLGQPLRAIRADAEARFALGDLVGAVDRLNAGQRRARSGGAVDFIDASVIDARLRDVELLRKQIKADEKGPR
jgi:beta-barrel assembly-enhancing protease